VCACVRARVCCAAEQPCDRTERAAQVKGSGYACRSRSIGCGRSTRPSLSHLKRLLTFATNLCRAFLSSCPVMVQPITKSPPPPPPPPTPLWPSWHRRKRPHTRRGPSQFGSARIRLGVTRDGDRPVVVTPNLGCPQTRRHRNLMYGAALRALQGLVQAALVRGPRSEEASAGSRRHHGQPLPHRRRRRRRRRL